MSDLISRNKAISVLVQLNRHSLNGKMDISNAIYLLENQPTAWDADKVVEKLEQRSKEYNSGVRLHGKPEEMLTDDAIEIVKQGGVADDVCEWEKGSSGYVGYSAYYSRCCKTKSNGLEMQTHIIADWKYCPYCGKKIKVVE